MLDRVLEQSDLPVYIQENASSWKRSLLEWQKTKIKKGQTFDHVQKIFVRAKKIQDYPSDQTADIDFMRAASLLHKELKDSKDPQRRAQCYSMLGEAYEVLSDLDNWELPELYYEACIREFPKSKIAKGCFKYFERSIIWGFSGSAGTFIPHTERKRLNELRLLAGY